MSASCSARFTTHLRFVLARSVLVLAVVLSFGAASKDAKSGVLGDTITGCFLSVGQCYYEFAPGGFLNNSVVAVHPGVEFFSSDPHDVQVSADFADTRLRVELDRLPLGIMYLMFRFEHSRLTGFDLISSTWVPPPPPPPCSDGVCLLKVVDGLYFGFTSDLVRISVDYFSFAPPPTDVVMEFLITTAEAGALAIPAPKMTAMLALAASVLIVIRRQRRVSAERGLS